MLIQSPLCSCLLQGAITLFLLLLLLLGSLPVQAKTCHYFWSHLCYVMGEAYTLENHVLISRKKYTLENIPEDASCRRHIDQVFTHQQLKQPLLEEFEQERQRRDFCKSPIEKLEVQAYEDPDRAERDYQEQTRKVKNRHIRYLKHLPEAGQP